MRRPCWSLVVPLALLATAAPRVAAGGEREMPTGVGAFAATRSDSIADAR